MPAQNVIHLAYAEDVQVVRDSLTDDIKRLDPRFDLFIVAENGRELIDQIDHALFQPEICILDVSMPEMDGYETMAALKKKYEYIRGIAFSMFDSEYVILKMFKNGATGFVSKNEKLETLKSAILEVAEMGYFFSDYVLKCFPDISPENITRLKTSLSENELQFLTYCGCDMTYEEIALKMNVSLRTAEGYAAKIREKLKIPSRIS